MELRTETAESALQTPFSWDIKILISAALSKHFKDVSAWGEVVLAILSY